MIIQNIIHSLSTTAPQLPNVLTSILQRSGKAILVGGSVRDLLLNRPIKDIDIEVYNLTAEQLQKVLSQFGTVHLQGKSFGVFRVNGINVDWSLPRKDSSGRKPAVEYGPFMRYEQAFARRDLTINAMGIDLQSGQLIDPFGGKQDLEKKVLRSPSLEFFVQDPLRLFRVMQFVGRFEMNVDPTLNAVCQTMDIQSVSRERIEQEFGKLLLQSRRPSLGIRWLHSIGRLQEIAPELAILATTPQRADFHPEGDVFEHTMQALDAATEIAQKYDTQDEKLLLQYAALCHDLGKATTTQLVNGIWRSWEHAKVGVPIAKQLLQRWVGNKEIIHKVGLLVYHHMMPGQLVKQDASPAAYKRLAFWLAPAISLRFLADLCMADRRGRNGNSDVPLAQEDPDILAFIERATNIGVIDGAEPPLVSAQDLLDTIKPGPKLGEYLKKAYLLQINKNISDKATLLKLILPRKMNSGN